MRRLAFFLVLGTATAAHAAGLDPTYLRFRNANGIHQAVGLAALRDLVKTKTLELQGKIVGTCRTEDSTILLLQRVDGDTQEVVAKTMPPWLEDAQTPVRLIVRCSRVEKNGPLTAILLAAAPEIDVLPVEEAYWRDLAEKRKAAVAVVPPKKAAPKAKPLASRGGTLYGRIGGRATWVLPASEVTPRYAAFIRARNPRLSPAKAGEIAQALVGFCIRYDVDARLVMAILMVESGLDPNAVSRSGAVGLGQLMPGTAQWMGVRNSYDTTDNLYGMVKLLRTHMDQYGTRDGSDPLVLAAYNAGIGAVKKYGGVPPFVETQNYVRKVTAIYARLCGR